MPPVLMKYSLCPRVGKYYTNLQLTGSVVIDGGDRTILLYSFLFYCLSIFLYPLKNRKQFFSSRMKIEISL